MKDIEKINKIIDNSNIDVADNAIITLLLERISLKVKFADAIIEEAKFNNIDINLASDDMEHQLGTVWVGDCSIQPMEIIKD